MSLIFKKIIVLYQLHKNYQMFQNEPKGNNFFSHYYLFYFNVTTA